MTKIQILHSQVSGIREIHNFPFFRPVWPGALPTCGNMSLMMTHHVLVWWKDCSVATEQKIFFLPFYMINKYCYCCTHFLPARTFPLELFLPMMPDAANKSSLHPWTSLSATTESLLCKNKAAWQPALNKKKKIFLHQRHMMKPCWHLQNLKPSQWHHHTF